VTGIGFLGAGVIWRQKEEAVRGITTAASIWVAAAVGIAVGVGYYSVAFLVSLVTMIVLSRGHPIQVAKENLPTEIKVINESY
jgi:putative Mg2+ transporter-C (MgtC) family protein